MKNNRIYPLLITWLLIGLLSPIVTHAAMPSLSASTVYWTTAGKVSSATTGTAKLGATIDADGGTAIIDRGIVWNACGVNPDPLVTDNKVSMGTGTGIFSGTVSVPNATRICFKGYATNNGVDYAYSPVSSFYTEPDPVTVASITDPGYFELTVNFPIPDTSAADGVVVVVRQQSNITVAPYDGTLYTANARIGLADTTNPDCLFYCEAVVADEPAIIGGGSGSVTVTGLKDGYTYYAAAFSYKGSGIGISGINYNQSLSSISAVTTSAGLISHNEKYVAGTDNGDGTWTPAPETSEGCANCHGAHHTSQLLPTGLAMTNNCFSCHSAAGDVSMHASGQVDCGTCHSLHSFRKEELYSTNNRTDPPTKGFNQSFVRANMSKYINTTDYPPPDGGGALTALDNTVFQEPSTDFAFATTDPLTGKYNGVCQTCHPATVSHHTQTATDGHQIGKICTSCHSHQTTDLVNAFRPSAHPVDFGKDDSCIRCHTGETVMEDIHGDGTSADCTICHVDPDAGNYATKMGASASGVDGDATLANGTAVNETWSDVTCLICHPTDPYSAPTIHHDRSEATGGTCVFCHKPDVGQKELDGTLTPRTSLAMPANLACNWCHLWWPNNKDYYTDTVDEGYSTANGTVKIFRLVWDPNSATLTPTPRTWAYSEILDSHSISTNTGTPISDYAACFDCHGAEAATRGGGKQVRPFHGFGPAVTGFEPYSGNSSSSTVLIEWYAGPNSSGPRQDANDTPWHPGFGAFHYLATPVQAVPGQGTNGKFLFSARMSQAHADDLATWNDATRITAIQPAASPIAFSIPWDNYGPTHGGPTGTSDLLNTGGQTGAFTMPTTVPLVRLDLPSTINP